MALFYRKYKKGDEKKINELYRQITGIDRSEKNFKWEWINTWDGEGEMHLLFESGEQSYDELVAQYSLIPVPFSFYGKTYLTGKTENCMCHPAYRSKKIYFEHEKRSFEKAKSRFDVFYTTAGHVSHWAIARIRSKLGYIPFDSWSAYYFSISPSKTAAFILSEWIKRNRSDSPSKRALVRFGSGLLALYGQCFFILKRKSFQGEIVEANDENTLQIEKLWKKNKRFHGVSVDRSRTFLKWRIADNPHFDYQYLFLRKNRKIAGYAIYYVDKNSIMHIEDILVNRRNKKLFADLIDQIVILGKQNKLGGIYFNTLMANTFYRYQFSKRGFVDLRLYAIHEMRSMNKKQFLVYLPHELKKEKRVLDPNNWYITKLILEGRE